MGYFRRKMKQFISWAVLDQSNMAVDSDIKMYKNSQYGKTIGGLQNNSIEGHNGGLNFTVYSATGGKVIQTRTYNIATDQHRSALYVITDKEDLGQELGHIITVESLSR